MEADDTSLIEEDVPRSSMVYYEKDKFQEVLCKPKILPIKSSMLKRLEQMEREEQALSEEIKEESKNRQAF